MEMINELSAIEIQRKGLEALKKELGNDGAAQFMKLFYIGS